MEFLHFEYLTWNSVCKASCCCTNWNIGCELEVIENLISHWIPEILYFYLSAFSDAGPPLISELGYLTIENSVFFLFHMICLHTYICGLSFLLNKTALQTFLWIGRMYSLISRFIISSVNDQLLQLRHVGFNKSKINSQPKLFTFF